MKYLAKQILCWSLIFSIFFSFGACNGEKENGLGDETQALVTQQEFTLSEKYELVCGEYYKQSYEISDALSYVKKAMSEAYDVNSTILTDNRISNDAKRFEILIGDTVREESQNALQTLGINDYTYRVESENVIVICGGSAEATLEATKKFCLDVLGYDGNPGSAVSNAKITVGRTYTYKATYPYQSLTINGVDVREFKIAVANRNAINLAQPILCELGKYTGCPIPVVKCEELDGNEKAVICVGAFTRDGESVYEADCNGYMVKLSSDEIGLTVGIDAKSDQYYNLVTADFIKAFKLEYEGDGAQLYLPDENMSVFGFDNIPNWTLQSETTETVADGVTYIAQYYTDEKELPYRTHTLIIDPEKAYLYMGTGNDTYELVPSVKQTVPAQMQAVAGNGLNVIAGINADFFEIDGDYHPSGLTIKEGTLITRGDAGRAYVGFTYDGKVVVGKSGLTADIDNLKTAVGGSQVIVSNGAPDDVFMNDSFGYTNHPRSLVGVRDDGKIILSVIDGRQETVSNGASLARCALFMVSMGAQFAVNLDGGGSSTLVVREGDDFHTINSTAYGNLRKVYNSLLVIQK